MSNYPPNGPVLRYTNDKARQVEKAVKGLSRDYNDDLYDLLKWAEELRQERDARYTRAQVDAIIDLCNANCDEREPGIVDTEQAEQILKNAREWP